MAFKLRTVQSTVHNISHLESPTLSFSFKDSFILLMVLAKILVMLDFSSAFLLPICSQLETAHLQLCPGFGYVSLSPLMLPLGKPGVLQWSPKWTLFHLCLCQNILNTGASTALLTCKTTKTSNGILGPTKVSPSLNSPTAQSFFSNSDISLPTSF